MTDGQIDALVAEHVMHRPPRDIRIRGGTSTVRVYPRPGDASCADGTWHDHELARSYGAPRYSTDIASAWQVVEEMRRRGFLVSIEDDASDEREPLVQWWNVLFYSGDKGDQADLCQKADAPKAICLAALRALGADVTP